MKAIERQIEAAEDQIIKQSLEALFDELKKEISKRDKVCAALDDIKAFNEISHIFVGSDDMSAVKKIYNYHIAIINHHLPSCAIRIRDQISWL